MEALKYARAKTPHCLPANAALHKVSWLQRLVRYEWRNAAGRLCLGPAFQATLQEWERALD